MSSLAPLAPLARAVSPAPRALRSRPRAGRASATTAPAGTANLASRRRRRRRSSALRARAGPEDAPPPPASAAPDPADARAALLAKAAAYKKAALEDSKRMGGKAELESVLTETTAALERAKKDGGTDAGDGRPDGKREVRVKIVTREKNYDPFDEDERAVGFEEGRDAFIPEAGAAWGAEEDKSVFKSMLETGRRRERGLGVDNDAEEVITFTTQDDERYNLKKRPAEKRDANESASEASDSGGSADGSSADGAEDPASAGYEPKVNTWGVFPRPENISKAYGGGRTIKAGEFAEETEEQKEARRERVRAKLNKYRKDAGIVVDNATLSRWQVALTESKNLMRAGKLAEARDLLEPICVEEKINPKTELGGEITFTYGMCLDNTQRRDEALEMYKRCVGCPHGRVSKDADRMIWGMTKARDFMKADQFDYDAIKDKYDPFLIKMTNEKKEWKIETNPEEEERLERVTGATVLAVFAVPLAMIGFIATR